MQPVQMNFPETKPLIDANIKSKYMKYSLITTKTKNAKHDFLDTISESFDAEAQTKKSNACSSVGGLLCIAIAVIDWVLMSEVIQSSEENNYNQPFFIRFMVNSSYAFLFIPWFCVHSFNKRVTANNMTPNDGDVVISYDASALVMNDSRNTFHIIISLMLVNFMSLSSGYIWYLSLSRTVASINNTIFQSNCVFVLIYSYFLLDEQFSSKRLFAALIAIGGVVLISFTTPSASASESTSSSLIGIILCVISMMLFAFFEVLFKYFGCLFFRSDTLLSDTLLFQSAIGLCNIVMFWPFLLLLNHFGIEAFALPTTYNQFINAIVFPCCLDLIFTCALLCGITLSGALFMSMGLILVIPITFFADIVVFQKATNNIVNIYSVTGAALIVIGFIMIQIDHKSSKHSQKEKGAGNV